MNQLGQLTDDVRGFAAEIRNLGYSSVSHGYENQFLELSERMCRSADIVDRPRSGPCPEVSNASNPTVRNIRSYDTHECCR